MTWETKFFYANVHSLDSSISIVVDSGGGSTCRKHIKDLHNYEAKEYDINPHCKRYKASYCWRKLNSPFSFASFCLPSFSSLYFDEGEPPLPLWAVPLLGPVFTNLIVNFIKLFVTYFCQNDWWGVNHNLSKLFFQVINIIRVVVCSLLKYLDTSIHQG